MLAKGTLHAPYGIEVDMANSSCAATLLPKYAWPDPFRNWMICCSNPSPAQLIILNSWLRPVHLYNPRQELPEDVHQFSLILHNGFDILVGERRLVFAAPDQ